MERIQELRDLINEGYKADMSKDDEFVLGGYLDEAFRLLDKGKFGKWVRDNLVVPEVKAYNMKWWFNRNKATNMTIDDLPSREEAFKKDSKDRSLLEDFIAQFEPDNPEWSIIFRKMLVEVVNTYRED